MKALEKYPLPPEEKREVIKTTLLSEVLLLIVSFVVLVVIVGVVRGDWLYAVTAGWLDSVLYALGPINSVGAIVPPPPNAILPAATAFDSSSFSIPASHAAAVVEGTFSGTLTEPFAASFVDTASGTVNYGSFVLYALCAGAVFSLVLLGLLVALDFFGGKYSASYRRNVMAIRQGITGELVRVPMTVIAPSMLLVGFTEELLFRFILMNGLIALVSFALPRDGAVLVALVVSAILFWLVHAQYRDPWTSSIAIAGGLLLGGSYILTGCILVPMIAHALYDTLEILLEQIRMGKESDYFGGKVPTSILRDMAKAQKAEKPKRAQSDSGPARDNPGPARPDGANTEEPAESVQQNLEDPPEKSDCRKSNSEDNNEEMHDSITDESGER